MGTHAFPDRIQRNLWNPLSILSMLPKPHPATPPAQASERPALYRAGQQVRVRCALEILSTLDAEGRIDGLPFLSEMLPLIGSRAIVRETGLGASVRLETAQFRQGAWHCDWLAPVDTEVDPLPKAEAVALDRLRALSTRTA